MSRRRPPREEQHFGSDSFLDVIANVVGILIILMVLAGLRASKMPAVVVTDEPSGTAVAVMTSEPAVDSSIARREELTNLQSQAERLQGDLEVLRRAAAERETRLSELQSQDVATRNRLTALGSTLEEELSALEQNRRAADELSAAAQAVRVKLKRRQAEIAAAEQPTHRVERLEHRITPVSRLLNENETELHFRCFGGRVAVVPIDELVERMKTQMDRQRDFIVRSRRYAGSVGPVQGFSMNYIVEREEPTTLDSLRGGGGMVRIMVSQWELIPETDLEAEPTEAALRAESAFRNELRKAEPGSTITFWVYPDSFSLYRQLQALCHREGYSVAARPMPEGTQIMGSPRGSRSAAQ